MSLNTFASAWNSFFKSGVNRMNPEQDAKRNNSRPRSATLRNTLTPTQPLSRPVRPPRSARPQSDGALSMMSGGLSSALIPLAGEQGNNKKRLSDNVLEGTSKRLRAIEEEHEVGVYDDQSSRPVTPMERPDGIESLGVPETPKTPKTPKTSKTLRTPKTSKTPRNYIGEPDGTPGTAPPTPTTPHQIKLQLRQAGPIMSRVHQQFRDTYHVELSSDRFIALCAYLSSLLTLGLHVRTVELDSFMSAYNEFEDALPQLQADQENVNSLELTAYHDWWYPRRAESADHQPILTGTVLRELAKENPFVFLRAILNLKYIAQRNAERLEI